MTADFVILSLTRQVASFCQAQKALQGKTPQSKVAGINFTKTPQAKRSARQNKAPQSFFKRIQALKFLFLRVF